MSVDQSGAPAPVPSIATGRPLTVLVVLGVLVAAALASAATFVRYSDQLAELGAGFADVDLVMRIFAWAYGGMAAVVVGGAALVALRLRAGTPLLRAVLVLSVPVQALTCYVVIADSTQILGSGVRVIGDRSVALAATQLTAVVATAIATAVALTLLLTHRRSPPLTPLRHGPTPSGA
jgi:hypothetical protein